jgi:predicted protein tyrosine phosphatase
MQIFTCPKDWTFATDRFTPDHLVSLQNPGADVSGFRPPWVLPENHYIGYFWDIDDPDDPEAPGRQDIQPLIDWLTPRCHSASEARIMVHCDAGLGRSPAAAYIAWSLFLGAGKEHDAFEAMKASCLRTLLMPNTVIIAHADAILRRNGALKKPLTEWNRKVRWSRTYR